MAFLQPASGGNVAAAYERFVDTGFRHHNPCFEGTAQALMAGMQTDALQNPDKIFEVKRVVLPQLMQDNFQAPGRGTVRQSSLAKHPTLTRLTISGSGSPSIPKPSSSPPSNSAHAPKPSPTPWSTL